MLFTLGIGLPAAELVEVKRIWDAAPHNAFTDLIRYRGQWFCAFREGTKHVSADGSLRVLASGDGRAWSSAALLTSSSADLRDPKLSVTQDGRLLLTAVGALHTPAAARHQTMAWFSSNGREWSEPVEIGEPDMWLWRVTWHKGAAYGIGYNTTGHGFVRLYVSQDGRRFDPLVDRLFDRDSPSEAALVFLPDDTAVCLLRCDRTGGSAQLGTAAPPYREWTWKDLGKRIGGPQLIRAPDGTLLAGTRLLDGKTRTAVCRVDLRAGTLAEVLALPSGGDTSYPGMVWHDGLLWMSYYSTHEGKTSIYLAKIRVP